MKKILLASISVCVLLFTGCSKEETTPLSEFILGSWVSKEISIISNNDQKGIIYINFNDDGTYSGSFNLINGTTKTGEPSYNTFEVDNKRNTLLMGCNILHLLGFQSSGDPIMFNVEFSSSGEDTMKLRSGIASIGLPEIILTRTQLSE